MSEFDQKAATWDDDPAKVERAARIARAIADRVPLDGAAVLDFGAGTGLLGLALQPRAARVVLADASAGMVEVARAKVAARGLSAVTAVQAATPAALAGHGPFDLVCSLMALHHVEDVPGALREMAALLAPGGRVALVDLEAEDGSFHGEGFTGHRGFEPSDIARWLAAAGLADVSVTTVDELVRDTGRYPLFLAMGDRHPVSD